MTIAEVADAYSGCQTKAPGYYGDTANAGADAFSYKMNIVALAPEAAENDDSGKCWLDWGSQPLDKDSNVSFEKVYGSFIAGHADYRFVDVYVSVMAACDDNRIPTSSVIRGLEEGTPITIEFVNDDRKTGSVPAPSGDIEMHIATNDGIDGGLAYGGDSENIGREYFNYSISFLLSNGIAYTGDSIDYDKNGRFMTDEMRSSDLKLITEADRILTITSISVSVLSKLNWDNDSQKLYSISDKIRAMGANDSFTIYAYSKNPVTKPKVTATAGNGSATLTWEAVNGASAYAIAIVENGRYNTLTTTFTGTEYEETGLENGRSYTFLVQAKSGHRSP